MGEERVQALLQDSLAAATKTEAIKPSDLKFGVKVSVATTLARAKGGQFVTHVKALPGNLYDGHAQDRHLRDGGADRQHHRASLRRQELSRPHKFRVFTSGQKRRMTPKIKRALRRRSAVEPVIGHLKSEHRMGRNYRWQPEVDAPMPSLPPSATTSAG
jgi:IS5 family transposase